VSVRNLEALLRPRSVAVFGASNQPRSVGAVVMRNLLRAGFEGPVLPVNPKAKSVAGVLAYPDVAHLPVVPELAVICTPAAAVPGIVGALGDLGTRAAVILSAGLAQGRDAEGRSLLEAVRVAAGRRGFRILGPNCLGLLVPGSGLDASFSHVAARPGRLAFLSQSGALGTAVLDWAAQAEVGLSCFASIGDSLDVDAADLLDWFGADPETDAILLYLESIGGTGSGGPPVRLARKLLSAARAAARNKPVLALKSGRVPEGARAAFSHTGALAGSDAVWDAALQRAGVLRVRRIDELFDAAETLVRAPRLRGDRIAILSNGGGLAVLATDCLVEGGGRLAELAPDTIARLDAVLPATWSRSNPVDVIGDAPGRRYEDALRIVLGDPGVDVVLVVHAPTALASGEEAARAVARVMREDAGGRPRPNVLASWVGGEAAEAARGILHEVSVPTYRTPEDAISACSHLLEHRKAQAELMETPPSLPSDFSPDLAAARAAIDGARADGRDVLSEPEAKDVLRAFGMPVVETRIARDADEAARAASELGHPVAVKILSRDASHKSAVGGVVLDLNSAEEVRRAIPAMAERLAKHVPGARLEGYTVQRMARRPGAQELIVGIAQDPLFGPVVLFGHGGTAVERIGDRAVALPPLNLSLASALIERTRVARLLEGGGGRPPVDRDALALAIVQVAQVAVELPEVAELDVNPLLADDDGVLALDARIRLAPPAGDDAHAELRLAIRPYPRELEETVVLRDGTSLFLRPIRPEDEPAQQAFHARLTPEDIRFRFFNLVRRMPHSQMARFTQIDYDREMAFLALPAGETGAEAARETLGVVRIVTDPDNERAEFAIVVRSDQKGRGLGRTLLEKMIRYCRARGTRELVGQVLPDNRAMLELAERLGFQSRYAPADGVVEVRLAL
jgi:acetyltransferase